MEEREYQAGPARSTWLLNHPVSRRRTIKNHMHRRILAARHVRSNLPVRIWEEVPDQRGRQGRRYGLPVLLQALTLGLVGGLVTLRGVEELLHSLSIRKELGIRGTPSDTTLDRIVREVPTEPLLDVLAEQVRGMQRAKQLEPMSDLGLSLVAIDGKVIATDQRRLHPEQQDQCQPGADRFVLKVLRAVLVSSSVKPVIGQHVIPATAGEANTFPAFIDRLVEDYGRSSLVECISVDAGFTNRDNMAFLLDHHGLDYIAGLKGCQPTMLAEACRLLGEGETEPPAGWDLVEHEWIGSRRVTRMLARTTAIAGYHNWASVKQVWRVRQRAQCGEHVTWEDRFFLTSLPLDRLTPKACLLAIRAHWGIENDANWTFDAIWGEDKRAWVRQGRAMEVLSILRCLAFNIVRLLRHRVFRSAENRLLPYRTLLDLIRVALMTLQPAALHTGFS